MKKMAFLIAAITSFSVVSYSFGQDIEPQKRKVVKLEKFSDKDAVVKKRSELTPLRREEKVPVVRSQMKK